MADSIVDILLVEDNANDVTLTLRALERQGLTDKIEVVRDGATALDFIFGRGTYAGRRTENRPKLVLLDLKLPKVSGLEVLKQIKSDEQTQSIPVVVLTSSAQEQDVVESYRLGANGYMVKPVGFRKFSEAMSQMGMFWLLLNVVSPG